MMLMRINSSAESTHLPSKEIEKERENAGNERVSIARKGLMDQGIWLPTVATGALVYSVVWRKVCACFYSVCV